LLTHRSSITLAQIGRKGREKGGDGRKDERKGKGERRERKAV